MLMRRPRNSLHGRDVAAEAVERGFGKLVPYAEFIVVTARGQLPVLSIPAQPTNFLLMAREATEVLIRRADVAVVDETVAAARGEDMIVPSESTNAGRMPRHCAKTTGLLRVVDLHEALICADGDVAAALDPGDGGYEVVVFEFAEFGHFAAGRVPHVNAGSQANTEDIGGAPVDEVEVKVVG
jgi:hypothetical protein